MDILIPRRSATSLRGAAALLCTTFGAVAHATPVSVIGASLVADNDGSPVPVVVQARFLGDPGSLYDNELFLDAPTFIGPVFNNHTTPVNQTASLGSFMPDSVLFIRNQAFLKPAPGSPASYNFGFFAGTGAVPPNPDGLPHAIFTFDPDLADGEITVSFEDQFGGGDLDFNDAVYSFTNVRAEFVHNAISPAVNPAGSTVSIGAGDTRSMADFNDNFGNEGGIDNSGFIINYGASSNSGTIETRGTLFNDLTGAFSNDGGMLQNSGTIRTFGTMTNNAGTIDNSGSLENLGGGTFSNAGGALLNLGQVVNGVASQFINGADSAFSNQGGFSNAGQFDNSGTVTNEQNATLTNQSGATFNNLDELLNAEDAQLNNEVGAVISNAMNATVNNNGSISNAGTVNNYGTILTNFIANSQTGQVNNLNSLVNVLGGSVVNMGGMDNAGTVTNLNEIVNAEGAQLDNEVGALITNAVNATVDNDGSISNAGTVDNYGSILTNFIANSQTGQVNNLNSLVNVLGGSFINMGGIDNDDGAVLENDGSFSNRDGGSLANAGSVVNTGSFDVDATSSVTGAGSFTQTAGSTHVEGTLDNVVNLLGGSLSGTGTVGGITVGPGGTVSPGNSPGTLHVAGDFALNRGAIEIQLAGTALHDVLEISGAADFTGGTVNYSFLAPPSAGELFTWLVAEGGVTGLESLVFNVSGGGENLVFTTVLSGKSVVLSAATVPLPGTLGFLLAGVAGLAGHRRLLGGITSRR